MYHAYFRVKFQSVNNCTEDVKRNLRKSASWAFKPVADAAGAGAYWDGMAGGRRSVRVHAATTF